MKRVDCQKCKNFIPPIIDNNDFVLFHIKQNAKCELGKRIMFRQPKDFFNSSLNSFGWIRYCDDFKPNQIK